MVFWLNRVFFSLLLCFSLAAQSPREFYAQDFFLSREPEEASVPEASVPEEERVLQSPEPAPVPLPISEATLPPLVPSPPSAPKILYVLFYLSGLLLSLLILSYLCFWLRRQIHFLQLRRLRKKYLTDCYNPHFKVELRALLGLPPGSSQEQILAALPKNQLSLRQLLMRHDAKFKPKQ
jgi:hypothetical protein